MEIQIANQRILLFKSILSESEAEIKAWDKKISSFGVINSVTSFLSKPHDDDFECIYKEHRFDPFWHVIARAKYVYDRNTMYQVPVGNPTVRAVTYENKRFEASNGHIHLNLIEHCVLEEEDAVFIDGVSGKNKPELKNYLSLSPKEVKNDLSKFIPKDSILVPPQTRVSAIMRDALAKMIKGIEADTVLEEKVEVPCVDLYYHPIYAFQYRWKSKNKEAIVEVDGLTGSVTTGNRTFNEYLGKVLDINFLFDVGADAAGMLIPGGSIAVKVAKKYIDSKKNKM
jgi:hypothetical protein